MSWPRCSSRVAAWLCGAAEMERRDAVRSGARWAKGDPGATGGKRKVKGAPCQRKIGPGIQVGPTARHDGGTSWAGSIRTCRVPAVRIAPVRLNCQYHAKA